MAGPHVALMLTNVEIFSKSNVDLQPLFEMDEPYAGYTEELEKARFKSDVKFVELSDEEAEAEFPEYFGRLRSSQEVSGHFDNNACSGAELDSSARLRDTSYGVPAEPV